MREKTIAIDFESTYGIEDDHGISKQGGKYFTDPRTDVYLVAFYDGADSWVGHPKDAPWGMLEGATVVAHNWAFEKAILDVYRDQWGVPPESSFQAHDTAALAAYLRSPRSLEAAAECLLGEKPDKDIRAQMEGRTAQELQWDFGGLWDEVLHYAAEDARLCWDLWDRYEHFWPEHERFLSNLQIEMGARGLPLDVGGLASDLTVLAGELAESEQQIPWLGKAPIASQTELARAIRQHADSGRGFKLLTGETVYDIPVPASIADGDWRWEKWLASYGSAFPAASAMKRYTKAKLRLDRIKGMLAREHDGRMGYSTMYFGALSGRPTGGEKMNVLNLPKDDIAGTNIRHRIAAADGRKLVVRDLSAIEPCCLHAMLGHTEFCDMVREGTDVYEAAARLQGLYDGDEPLKDADPDLRGQVKVGELAAVYGQGAARLAEQWKIPVDEAKRRVRKWRRDNPDITRQWKMFERQLANKIGGDLHIKLPSGRNMSFYQVTHDGVNDWGKPNLKASVTRDGERMRRLWGSIITENLCQSVARDVFSHGLILAEQAGLNPVLTVYDEVVCDVPAADAEDANQELDRCMTTPPEWMPTVPLRSEGKAVDRYSEAK